MTRPSSGRVYVWIPDSSAPLGGKLALETVPLFALYGGGTADAKLCGPYVEVHNDSILNVRQSDGSIVPESVHDAVPNDDGAFVFEPNRGGGRVDKCVVSGRKRRARYVEASRFGEVNAYYHADRIAAYIDRLLRDLGRASLPRVVIRVNAHHAAVETNGRRDGRRSVDRWHPFQGGHYRLPSRKYDIDEVASISVDGEIHIGPGRKLLHHGALVEAAGSRYRANASHNPGIIYHEYAHHLTRHTADFRANAFRDPLRQDNRKTAMDEGTCDYWTAVMLNTPHIWACHRHHDWYTQHPRSLKSSKTIRDFDNGPRADPHLNGTIWGAALWDFRCRLRDTDPDGARLADLLVVRALTLVGSIGAAERTARAREVRTQRKSFGVGLSALLEADREVSGGAHRSLLLEAFDARGIRPEVVWGDSANTIVDTPASSDIQQAPRELARLLRRVSLDHVPADGDILSADALESLLARAPDCDLSLLAGGDVMLGGRAKRTVEQFGIDYPFAAVIPLLARSPIVLANLEGPFAANARKVDRQFSYRVRPALAAALPRAHVNVVTLANNHLLDCDRDGVSETLQILHNEGVAVIGAGVDRKAAHAPVIMSAHGLRIGLLGYYWNRRTAATLTLPGSAMDPPELLAEDIRALRPRVDRIVVSFHWGIPYETVPSAEDRAKARFAIDCGADAVIGHHPHVLQPFEIHRGCPIFYSVGNFAFGSGNSRAEGSLIGLGFNENSTRATIYPLYVKNRDDRVNYQPKLLRGRAARRVLLRLARSSGTAGDLLHVTDYYASVVIPRADRAALPVRTGTDG